jgi:K+-sensing histidine kinase KdpD
MRKVLVIEDAPSLRKDILEMLGFEGFQAIGAENGLVGVERAREHLPDLIICDIMMPGLNGYGVLEELRKDATTATIPFIFLTARTDRVDVRLGMELGADDYLTKPFHAAELLATVRARLRKRDVIEEATRRKMEVLRGNIVLALPHELRTPLNVILGFSDLLMTDSNSMEAARVTDMARHINSSAMRLYRLIENFLVYAHTEILMTDPQHRDRLKRNFSLYPRTLIGNSAYQQASQFARGDDVQLEMQDVEAIGIAEESLKKVVEELVDNACKFSSAGTPIVVRSWVSGDQFVVSVTNQGRGLTREQIETIGAYMQFDRRVYEQQGAGLGLIISKRLIELAGGSLTIESVPSGSTTVRFALPVRENVFEQETVSAT